MNYLPRNKAKSHYLKPVLFLGVILALGFVLNQLLGGLLISAVVPLWRAESGVGRTFAAMEGFFSSRQTLLSENARLRERVVSLELELASRSAMGAAESALLSALGRRVGEPGIAAAVLARPPQTPYDILVLDAGTNDGVAVGSQVSLPEGPALGQITETFSGTSKVRLFSSPGEKTSAVLERENLPVMIEGAGGGNFRIVIPREAAVEVGDRVLYAGVSSDLIAVVEEIKLEPTDSFKEVLARSPGSPFSIRFVMISR